jgi:hypothetical protein
MVLAECVILAKGIAQYFRNSSVRNYWHPRGIAMSRIAVFEAGIERRRVSLAPILSGLVAMMAVASTIVTLLMAP